MVGTRYILHREDDILLGTYIRQLVLTYYLHNMHVCIHYLHELVWRGDTASNVFDNNNVFAHMTFRVLILAM